MTAAEQEEDLEEAIERIESVEDAHDTLVSKVSKLQTDMQQMQSSMEEVLLILRTIKLGGNIISWLAYALKWVGIIAVAIMSVFALIKGIETGTVSIHPTKIPD